MYIPITLCLDTLKPKKEGSEAVTRKTHILGMVYNALDKELVRTQTLVKGAIVQVDATPYKQWYLQHYDKDLGRKKTATSVGTKKEGEQQNCQRDALARHMLGSEYGEQDRKAAVLYEYETFKSTEGELLLDTYIRYLQVINNLKKCGYSKDNCELNFKFLNNLQPDKKQGDVNDAMKSKKKPVVITSDPLALVAEQTKKDEKKVDEKKKDMSKVKCYNCKKEGHFAKDCKKAKVKDYEYYKTKMLLAKKDKDEQVLLAEDHAWMESSKASSSSSDDKIAEMIKEFDKKIVKYHKRLEKANQQSKDFENQTKFLQEQCDVLQNQTNTFKETNNKLNKQTKVLNEKNDDLLAPSKVLQKQLKVKHVVIDNHVECQAKYDKLEEERYEYMIRYSTYFNNDKQHRKQIADQEILFDKMSYQLVELDENVRMLKNTILEKDLKVSQLKECVHNKDLETEKCLKRLNECFENPSYFKKAKDLRSTLYDERVIVLRYTSGFLIHSDEALEIEKFKRARETKIEFAYDYESLNASYANKKIKFSDDYYQEIINLDFEKIDSPFQQTSSLKLYVLNVILEKIIIDLKDEVMSHLEKEKSNLELIESLKSKGFKSSENAISESENQSENDCQVVEKECDRVENSKVIVLGMFKISVSQSVSPTSVTKTSCASNSVETKLKRKRRKRTSSKQHDKQMHKDVLRVNKAFVYFSDLDTLSSVRRPKLSGVL
uniref:40S ribosomal protein S8 n=1 Tax=Tanacetum cinerariifolium TaxID=118510 RepID=A0A6L2JC59_TANCI|nr:40S ribosomal protein S8 [Tanacetum cinerariifolium]